MNLNYRQGLISFQQSGSQPLFLLPSSTAGHLDLSVSPTPLIGTIAHGSSDYLLKFDATIPAAFGPLVSGQNNYLYLELNVISGEITRGITTLEPVHSTTEPTGTPGLMWFDLNANVYKVRNNQNTKWVESPRLVLAIAVLGNPNQLIYKPVGSEIALLNGVEGHPGYLMLDSQLRPLRTSTGELLTSDTPVRLKTTVGTAGVLSSPVNTFVPVRANEPIPALRLVYFTSADAVSLASSDPALVIPKFPVGLVQQPLAQNEVGVITQAGEIVSDQWNGSLGWADADIGKPLYCGYNGEVTLTRPSGVQAYRVGYVKNNKSVLFNVDSETKAQVVSAPGSVISGVPPISAVTALNGVGEIVTTISMSPADSTHDGFMSMLHVQALSTFDSRITANTIDITTLQSSKADVGHVHTIAEVTALQGALDTLTADVAARIPLVSPSTTGNIPTLTALGALVDSGFAPASFALASHQHFISDVTGLQDALNAKRNITTPILISEVTNLQSSLDGKASFVHTHVINDVAGLQTALNNKANVLHFHSIADVTGLQEALDLKFNAADSLPLAQVIGLVSALAGKASLVHVHAVSDVTGLQALLDGKAAVSHTHTASQITDFNVAVNTEVASLLQAGANIQLQYNAGSGQLVIAAVHNHPISEVTGLQSALDGKAPLVHVHGISEITGLQTALDGKSNVGHTHVYSDVTNFGAGVSAKLHAGSNITLTYDGVQDWTTIAATVPAQTPLQFFEGVSARGSYPTVTSLVFGAGLTATTAGDTLTITAPSVHTLDGLDDVVTPTPAAGDVLTFDGTTNTWKAAAPTGGAVPNLFDLLDVSIGTTRNGQVLTYNNTTGFWENVDPIGLPWILAEYTSNNVSAYPPIVDNTAEYGYLNYQKFQPYDPSNTSTSKSYGYGDQSKHSTLGVVEADIGIIGNYAPGTPSPIDGTQTLTLDGFYLNSSWQITMELILDTTYLGFADDFQTNPASGKNVTVNFQIWNSTLPTTPAEAWGPGRPFEMSCTRFAPQTGTNPFGSEPYTRFVASAEFKVYNPGMITFTWNTLDIPVGVGTTGTGQQYSRVVGYRLSMHRIWNGIVGA
jgi:hypothetical protein